LLPYLEQGSTYNAINFSLRPEAIHQTLSAIAISIFLCPSDRVLAGQPSMNSYAGNAGVGGSGDGFFSWVPGRRRIGFELAADGLSTTAAMSEWCLGVPLGERDARRSVFRTAEARLGPQGMDRFAEECHSLDISTAILNGPTKGEHWWEPAFGCTVYNHTLPIDDHTCTNGTLTQEGAWTAGSQHSAGCNVLFADGHVQFVKATTAVKQWRAIGTMNGGELLSGNDP
jgi:prepilin-type processing-associated H-X9-DG protein